MRSRMRRRRRRRRRRRVMWRIRARKRNRRTWRRGGEEKKRMMERRGCGEQGFWQEVNEWHHQENKPPPLDLSPPQPCPPLVFLAESRCLPPSFLPPPL